MASTNGFFWDSIDHDRVYNASSFENWLKKFFTSGVFEGDLFVSLEDDLVISVGSGYCNIDGKVQMFETPESFSISPGDPSHDRVDSVVVERDDIERDIKLRVIPGNPGAIERTWGDKIKQLVLAQISVPKGATSITRSNIKDTRLNKNLCGIVAGTVKEIDFSRLQQQFDAYIKAYRSQNENAYKNFLRELNSKLSGAGDYEKQFEAALTAWRESQESAQASWQRTHWDSFEQWLTKANEAISADTAANLMTTVSKQDDRMLMLEYMIKANDFFVPLLDDDGNPILDDEGSALLSDWKYAYM